MVMSGLSPALSELPRLDAVLWSYRLILGRDPENIEVIASHLADNPTIDEIRDRFISSEEFLSSHSTVKRQVLDDEIQRRFVRYSGTGSSGFITDWLGTKTRCSYLPSLYAAGSGIVEGPPGTERFGIHEMVEWKGTLRSVMEARDRFVAVELGAGWGPWLVASAAAAKQLGIHDLTLAGFEGASSHWRFLQQHFIDNGLDPAEHRLVHAVVGRENGTAYFPKLQEPSASWGDEAAYGEQAEPGEFEAVDCVSLKNLLADLPRVDLLHCDIQGAEGDVLSEAAPLLTERVRRMVIGTHKRSIEETLMSTFSAFGWCLEDEKASQFIQSSEGHMQLINDGVQVWHNSGFS